MNPAPIPWIGCGAGSPPEITGDSVGSTANTLSLGHAFLRMCDTPVRCPPVPTPVMIASIGESLKSARISCAVVASWTAMLAGLSNCAGIHELGVWPTSSSARAIAPFIPFSRGVRSKVAP